MIGTGEVLRRFRKTDSVENEVRCGIENCHLVVSIMHLENEMVAMPHKAAVISGQCNPVLLEAFHSTHH